MNKFLTYTLALASLTFATSCSDKNQNHMETGNQNHMENGAMNGTTMMADSTATPAGTATVYTCPMHPEVVASQPGQCPKCGMDLVVKK
ncbi:heavy metal-binding domain-containing protein [Hymenobacter siberiensis]|jgi:hypothetical protein|uniref:heavy metal-binding domain-containing protein n=1 Tax=Hymenobacter siberiensis TaxID=2848396 RepID=UPI001C1E58ED|nr:heavy metal-binding domain-containing protein [Hymenobacter siberiensis]MBU6121241.1 hypothetical protein [Hymenobacter siberiensis]